MATTQTKIDATSIPRLRTEITDAISAVLKKHHLRVSIGNITYEPNREFRCKLTVLQPDTGVKPNVLPNVGETWRYGKYNYKVVGIEAHAIIVEREVRMRHWGRVPRQYRIKKASFYAGAVKLA